MESSACIVKLSGPPPTFLPVHGSDKWAGLEPGDPQTHWMVLQKSVRPSPRRAPRSSRCAADMANQTNTSAPFYSYEYYLDYLDLIPVDERKLKANKRKSSTGEATRQRLGVVGSDDSFSIHLLTPTDVPGKRERDPALRDNSERGQNSFCYLLS